MAAGSGDAISSKGVAMFLTKGRIPPYTAVPSAVSKSKPTVVTVPAADQPYVDIGIVAITSGTETTFQVSASDYALLQGQGTTPTVRLEGFTSTWGPLNGEFATTLGAPGANEFSVAVDSSTFGAAPAPQTIDASVQLRELTYAVGQLVRPLNTGFTELDGKLFSIEAVDDEQITLLGSDTSGSRATLNTVDAQLQIWDSAAMVRMCLTGFTFNPETPGTNNVGTYCNPSATLPSTATSAGTATLSGWIDKDNPGYRELVVAADDATEREFAIVLPQEQGEIVAPITFSSMSWDIPLDGGMAFTGTGALGANPRHLFD